MTVRLAYNNEDVTYRNITAIDIDPIGGGYVAIILYRNNLHTILGAKLFSGPVADITLFQVS